MTYLWHFLNVAFKILFTSYPYNRLGLFYDYAKLNFKSVIHHKVTKGNKENFQTSVLGYHIHFLNYAHLINLLEEIFIYQAYKFQPTGKAPHIIDCGSNIGLSILYFKKIFPECHIIAFEPDPESFSLLARNIEKNNLTHIQLHNLALSDVEGESKLFQKSPAALSTTTFESDDRAKSISVPACKLSGKLITPTALIKIDIEGSEIQVIEDLIETHTIKKAETLIIEYHPRITKVPMEHFISRIVSHGFTCTKKIPASESGETDYILHFQNHAHYYLPLPY